MLINELNDIEPYSNVFDTDSNGREIKIYQITNAIPTSESLIYPNVLLSSNERVIRPIRETIMSLKSLSINENHLTKPPLAVINIKTPVFFFIYNTENYYHFIYDTLPYLISFFKLKKEIPDLKLLMNYPNKEKKEHYKFVTEFLSLLGVSNNDIIIISADTMYDTVYISTSYTHDNKSNIPPRNEIFDLYGKLIEETNVYAYKLWPKKIYISRRTWKHNDFKNIGTNYTTRRSLINETELVEYLVSIGYTEIFTEKLSTIDKITMFNNATHIIGSIGGGISNVLFSKPEANLIAIESPGFLDVNERFIYSLNRVNLNIFKETSHVNTGEYLKYMRVKYGDIIGEIVDINGDKITISYTKDFVAGWNNDTKYEKITVDGNLCEKLDKGLNSPWSIGLNAFKNYVN